MLFGSCDGMCGFIFFGPLGVAYPPMELTASHILAGAWEDFPIPQKRNREIYDSLVI